MSSVRATSDHPGPSARRMRAPPGAKAERTRPSGGGESIEHVVERVRQNGRLGGGTAGIDPAARLERIDLAHHVCQAAKRRHRPAHE